MKKNILVFSILWASAGVAQIQKIDLTKDLSSKVPVNLYEISSQSKKTKLSGLSQLKSHAINLRWSECVKLAPQVFQTQKEVQGWVALTWLRCLEQDQKNNENSTAVDKALSVFEKHPNLFKEGPWSKEAEQIRLSFYLDQIERLVDSKNPKTAKMLDSLLEDPSLLNADQKAKAYQLLGDLAWDRSNFREARFFYEEAQNQKDSKYLNEKLEKIAKKLGKSSAQKESTAAKNSEGEELKIEEHIRQSLKQNDSLSALKDTLVILNKFPGSRTAKKLKDKPLEIYNSLNEKAAKQAALNELSEADGARLLDWAQSLHRRGDYNAALVLADKMALKNPRSPSVTSALWIAGRCAHFLGLYDRALEYFNMLAKFHNGTDESVEALFRSGVIYFRKKDFPAAESSFEKVVNLKSERYDLSARYWLVRVLQEEKSDRAKQVRSLLIEKYPFSYYGLRLRAESQDGKLSWPELPGEAPDLEHELYLVGAQKKSWSRFKILSDAGWVNEAQAELSFRPFIKDPTLKVTLAQKMSERHQYYLAIKLLNEAMESDVRLRREKFVKFGYPKVYTALYRAEAERYKISQSLLKSLTRQESSFDLQSVSSSNALGLMQMIPPTAQDVSKKLGLKIELPNDMFRPEVNIPMGSYYVAQMLEQFQGNVPFALAAYNAGPHRLKNWLDGRTEVSELVPQINGSAQNELWFDELPWTETSFYVKAILRNLLLYRLVDEGAFTLNPVLWADSDHKKSE
ncbi:MAG: lytic transglycosylase domain-containing protein [Bdellovibrio sp.]